MTRNGINKIQLLRTFLFLALPIFLVTCQSSEAVVPISTPSDLLILNSADGYLERGDAYADRQNWDAAIRQYDQALLLKPEFAEAYNNRGYAYYWKGDAAHAITDYDQAIQLRPNYPYAYNNRGAAYMATGEFERAIPDLNQAISLQPDFPQAYTNRGNAYLRTGHFVLALADFRRAGQNPVGGLLWIGGVSILVLLLVVFLARRRFSPARGADFTRTRSG